MKFHEEALNNVTKSRRDEATLSAALGQHLFSQLITGNKFVVDENAPRKVEKCPCRQKECGKSIEAGCTAIGMIWQIF